MDDKLYRYERTFLVVMHFTIFILCWTTFSPALNTVLHCTYTEHYKTPFLSQITVNFNRTMDVRIPVSRTFYSNEQLFSLRNTTTKLSKEVRLVTKELGITRRGCRAGSRVHRPIKTRITCRNNGHERSLNDHVHTSYHNLRPVKQVKQKKCKNRYPTAMLTNVRSLNKKIDELSVTVNHYGADIVGVTETWFGDSNPAIANSIEGYKLFHRDRTAQRGGGVALYLREDLHPVEFEPDQVPAHLEIIWIEVTLNDYVKGNTDLFICVVYSPP